MRLPLNYYPDLRALEALMSLRGRPFTSNQIMWAGSGVDLETVVFASDRNV